MKKLAIATHAIFYGVIGAVAGMLLVVNTDGVADLLDWPEFGELAPTFLVFGVPILAVIGLIFGGWRGSKV